MPQVSQVAAILYDLFQVNFICVLRLLHLLYIECYVDHIVSNVNGYTVQRYIRCERNVKGLFLVDALGSRKHTVCR